MRNSKGRFVKSTAKKTKSTQKKSKAKLKNRTVSKRCSSAGYHLKKDTTPKKMRSTAGRILANCK